MNYHYLIMKMNFMMLGKLESLEQAFLNINKPLNVEETARYLNCSPSTVYKYIHKGYLVPSRKNNKNLWFDRKMLDKWMLDNEDISNMKISRTKKDYLKNFKGRNTK
jgi:excisionase family DNA binding protein